ncbi:MAG: AAA family ATPase [Limnochordia bacterium]|jgi:stage V sporulation protein K
MHPLHHDEVLRFLSEGKLSTADALRLLRQTRAATTTAKDKAAPPAANPDALRQALAELNLLVGLKEVKGLVREILAFVEIQNRRRLEGLNTEPTVLHMIFQGNPGTGKTTVARILGKILREMAVLPKGHLVEVERADLVGEYIGHTALKTREQVRKALGGILFIDEAYSLARGGEKDFGKEAIDTLVKAMEDHKNQFILILAGYRLEMERFLQTNPGLRSRFPIHIDFVDYTLDELLQIAELFVTERQYKLSPGAKAKLLRILQRRISSSEGNFGNARLVRNLLEKAIRQQAVRLVNVSSPTREELMVITAQDLEGRETQ